MKKLLLAVTCLCLPMLVNAQLQKVAVKKATATSEQSGEGAALAIDGNVNTIWHSSWSNTQFPVTFTIELAEESHVDMVRYVPRNSGSNGNWNQVNVEYTSGSIGINWTSAGSYTLNGSGNSYEFEFGDDGITATKIRFVISSGYGGFASAAEIEPYAYDNTKQETFQKYFSDNLFTELKADVTSADGIDDVDVKALVNNLLTSAEEYKKFRLAEYEPYRNTASLQRELKTSAQYNQWENPTGVYLKPGDVCYVAVEGITTESVGLKLKNWVKNENGSSYGLRNGLNMITASTEGNVFVDYYTDNYETAPNVKIHFINAPVRGYWDQATMTNDDWKKMLAPLPNDSSIIIVRSKHAQLAYPVCSWKSYCPDNVDSLMTLYQNVQWAERDMMGLEKYGRQTKNRQLFYATTYGFMAAGGTGAYCNVGSLRDVMTADGKTFGFWGVGHEWGHNNQITGFKWSGCGETTNNIYASWAEILFSNHPYNLRLEDEVTGINDYSGMRGGRMQTYFEEGLRKGVQWQLQDGPDYHGTVPETKTVVNYDYDGNYIGSITTTSRNYDHFVKLSPFWQMNLWGTLAGRCPDIIPMVIESIRRTDNYTSIYNTNGRQQMNFMKLACDSARIDLLPFFEKAGMLKPIDAYIEDYGAGWNKISQDMIDELKAYVAAQGYPAVTDEMNYITGHNYKIYRDRLKLEVPAQLGTGCTYANGKVTVQHSAVKNAVAFETYNSNDSLLRITMYGLGSNDAHSFTQVLYPAGTTDSEADASAYIVAVGYDGTRKKIYSHMNIVKSLEANKFYTITSVGKGNALSCGAGTTIANAGTIKWNMERGAKSAAMEQIWSLEKSGGNYYLFNPQSGLYLPGKVNEVVTSLTPKDNSSTWEIQCVNEDNNEYTFKSTYNGQYLNAHTATNTGYWSSGSGDANSRWVVEEVKSVTITIPSSGYYAACYPMALDLPDGVDAYTIKEVVEREYAGTAYNYAVIEPVTSTFVPAGMPVILNGTAGRHEFVFRAGDNTETDTDNILRGTTLKLTGITRSSGMFDVSTSNDAGSTATMRVKVGVSEIPANRAYMLRTDIGVSQVYLQTRDALSTDIKNVENEEVDAVLYDLNGAHVTKPQRGHVYITSSGKKLLIM